jgi:uncharacterized membrane protein YjgN (DUF898 family)
MNANSARLSYHGTGGSLLGLVLKNALLTMVTLGIYSFWAKNAVRVFHYSHTEMEGDRFAYHGTGMELLRGTLKAFGIILLLVIGIVALSFGAGAVFGSASQPLPPAMTTAFVFVLYGGIGILMVAAINGARRYRLSRSSWRGIRFSFHGKLGPFMGLMLKGILLSVVTLGFYGPFFANQRRAFLVNHSHFGSEPFAYNADGKELFGQYLKAFLLTIPTLGLYWAWYAAFQHRYFWGNTSMRGARFRSAMTGGELLKLHLTNLLLVIFTLGIGAAWAVTRTHAFFAQCISLHGTVDWATIQQRAQAATATAEGLAEGLDIDVGIGM